MSSQFCKKRTTERRSKCYLAFFYFFVKASHRFSNFQRNFLSPLSLTCVPSFRGNLLSPLPRTCVPVLRGTCRLRYHLHVSQVSGVPAVSVIIYACPKFHGNLLSPLSHVSHLSQERAVVIIVIYMSPSVL